MKLTANQTKIIGLTMELDLKTREYNELCKLLKDIKETNIDPNSPELDVLLKQFEKNQEEIIKIQKSLKALQEENKN